MTATRIESMEVTVPESLVAQIEGLTTKPEALGAAIGNAFGSLFAAIGRAGLMATGARAVRHSFAN